MTVLYQIPFFKYFQLAVNPRICEKGFDNPFIRGFLMCFHILLGFLLSTFVFLNTFVDYATISTVVVAPLFEELNRFNVLGYGILLYEVTFKVFVMLITVYMGNYHFLTRMLPSVIMHLSFFILPIPLQTRYLIHMLWNFYVLDVNTGSITYSLTQGNSFSVLHRSLRLFWNPERRVKYRARRKSYRGNLKLRKIIPHHVPAPHSPTPNMDLYRSFDFEPQSYASMAGLPAAKCKMIPLKLHEDMMFKTRTEMRAEKKDKKKMEREIRKRLTKEARFRAMKERIIAKASLPPAPPPITNTEEVAFMFAKHMLLYRSVMDELKDKSRLKHKLTAKQQELVSKLLDVILTGKSPKKISKLVKRITKTVPEKDHALRESLKDLSTLNFKPEMLGAIRSYLPGSVPVTHSISETDRTAVTALMTKVTSLSEKLMNTPLIAKGKLEVGLDFKSLCLPIGVLVASVFVAYLCYKHPAKMALAGLLAALQTIATMMFPDGILAQCVVKLSDAFKSCTAPTTEVPVPPDTPYMEVPLETHGLGTTLYSIAGPIITWFHYSSTGSSPKGSIVEKFMATSAMAEKLQKNVVFCSTTLTTFLSELFTWAGDALGLGNLKRVFDLHPELSDLEEKVKAIEEKLRDGTLFPDRDMAMAVTQYRTEVVKVVSKLKPGSAAAIRAGFLVKAIDVLYKTTSTGMAQNAVRAEPVCINLYSKPGKGKSTLCQSLAHEILASPHVLTKDQRDAYRRQRENYIYCIDATQNYPDGYYSQFVTILDDWAIRKDSLNADMESGLVALIRWVNGMPYNVESAHLELKGKIFANNILMIATTNNRKVGIDNFPGFTDINAIIRRLHMSYLLTIADEYCVNPDVNYENRSLMHGIEQFEVNPDGSLTQVIPYDVWRFVPWDMARGAHAYDAEGRPKPIQTYDQVRDEAVERILAARKFNEVHKVTIERRVEAQLALADAADVALEPQAYGDGKKKHEYNMNTPFWEANSSRRQYVKKHSWLRDAYVQYVQQEYKPEEVRAMLESEVAFSEYVEKLSKPYADDRSKCAKLLKGTFVDWFKFDLARTKNPEISAVDCVETSYTEASTVALNKLGLIWESITNWVQADPVKAALYAAIPLAVCAIPVAYSWFNATFFSPYEEESLQPKHSRDNVRGKSGLRSQLPRMARKVTLGPESGCSTNLVDISKVVNNNRFEIEISSSEGFRQCSAIAIYNRYLVLPRHMIMQFAAESESKPELRMKFVRALAASGSFSFSMTWKDMEQHGVVIDFKENWEKSETDRFNDRVILRIPETMMGCVTDIRKHLSSVNAKIWSQSSIEGTVNLIQTTPDKRVIEQFWDTSFACDSKINHTSDLSIINGLFYSCSTAKGFCGSPLYADVSGSAKLLGFHIAGNSDKYIAVGIALRQEDFDFLKETPVNVVAKDIPLESSSLEGDVDANARAGSGRVIAKLEKPIFQPSKTELRKAPMHDILPPCGLIPSALIPKVVDGVRVDPLIQGLTNYNRPRVMFPTDHMSEIAHSVYTTAVEHGAAGDRTLTFEEAIFGTDELEAIPKQTSLGLPLDAWATPTHKGKTSIMGHGDEKGGYKMPEFREIYEATKAEILAGGNPTMLLKAVVKDELLPEEKVLKANSRITFAAPFIFQVLMRQQYGSISVNIMKKKNMVRNRQALGLNVYSEWDQLATYLSKFGEDKMLDFDYRKYDGSLSRQLLNLVFDILDALSPNDSAEDRKIKAWIRAQTINACVAYQDVVVEFDGSNTSGNSLTSIINNFCNQILCLFVLSSYVLKKAGRTHESDIVDYPAIAENLRMCTLGDDVIMALGPLFEGITTRDFAEILGPYNIAITNGDKSDPITNPKGLRHISTVTFLKRHFKLIDGRYVAPLAMQSICKMIQWQSKNVSADEYKLIVQNALLEISLHGEEVYNECLAAMRSRMIVLGIAPHTASWRTEYRRAQKLEHTWQG